jgi:hypothetical protein
MRDHTGIEVDCAIDRDEAIGPLEGGTGGIAEWNRRCVAGTCIPDPIRANLR